MSENDDKTPKEIETLKESFKRVIGTLQIIGKTPPDDLKLFLDIMLPKEEVPNPQIEPTTLYQVVAEAVDPKFLHKDVIEDIVSILNQGQSVFNRRVSKGKPAIAGKDGKIVYLVKRLGVKGEIKVDDKGVADYAKVYLFDNIETGQPVARIYDPRPGFAGQDIFGKEIPAPLGAPFQYKLDGTLDEVSDPDQQEYRTLVAKENGYLYEENGQIGIRNELIITGDLDYHFGVVDFIGKVKVNGDVMPDFNITAREGIEIKGAVRGGSLVSTHGPIVVDGFVFGGANSRIISGATFTAKIVQEVNAEIKGDITILVEAMDSQLRTESTLRMEKGLLCGGKVSVVCGAEALLIGSELSTPTTIDFVGDSETSVAFSELKIRISNHDKAIKLIRLHLGPYADKRDLMVSLSPVHKKKMIDLANKLDKLEKGRTELASRMEAIAEISKKSKVNRVNVLGKMYPGSIIKVRDREFSPDTELIGPVSVDFELETGEFKVGDLKGLECAFSVDDVVTSNSDVGGGHINVSTTEAKEADSTVVSAPPESIKSEDEDSK